MSPQPLVAGSNHDLLSGRSLGNPHPQYVLEAFYNSVLATFYPASLHGVFPNTPVNMTTRIQEAFDSAPLGSTVFFQPGVYIVTPNALQLSRNVSLWAYGAVFDIGTTAIGATESGIVIGNTKSSGAAEKIRKQSFRGLWVKRSPAGTTTTDATGIGIKYQGLYECDIADMIATSFAKGHLFTGSYNTTDGESGLAYCNSFNLHTFECRYAIRLEPGDAVAGPPKSGWCNGNRWFGGRLTNSFTNAPGALDGAVHSTGVYIQWQTAGGSAEAHECNDNHFYGVNFENSWGRKIYNEGRYNTFHACRYETPRSAPSFPQRGVYFRRLQGTTAPGAYPYTIVTSTDFYRILVDTTAARTINLPAASGPHSPVSGDCWVIKDNTGGAGANNITIQGNGNTIDGGASVVINTNNGQKAVRFLLGEWKVQTEAVDEKVDVEFKETNAAGGSNGALVAGYDLLNNIISLPADSYNYVEAQQFHTHGENTYLRTRHIEAGAIGFPTFSRFDGSGNTGPVTAWNRSSGTLPSYEILAANGLDRRGVIRASADSLYVFGIAGVTGAGAGTERNWLGVRNASPYHWGVQNGLQVNVSSGTTGDFYAFGTAALELVRTDTVNDLVSFGGAPTGVESVQIRQYVRFDAGIRVLRTSTATDDTLNSQTQFVHVCDSSGAARTLTLPATDANNAGAGKIFVIKRKGGNNVTINVAAASSNTIDGAASLVLTVDKQVAWLMSNGGVGAAGDWELL